MNSTTLLLSKNWSTFSLRAVLITIINQLQLLTISQENVSLTTNIWQSKKSRARDRPKNRRGTGSRGGTSKRYRTSGRPKYRQDGGAR